jgi:hypothetical protein
MRWNRAHRRASVIAMRDESVYSMQLDWLDALLMLFGAVGLIVLTRVLGIDALKLRGALVIAGLMLGPVARRALVGPPAPYLDGHSRWLVFLALILIATGVLVTVMGALLADLRHTQHKPWSLFVLVSAVGAVVFAIGALIDRSQRDRERETPRPVIRR